MERYDLVCSLKAQTKNTCTNNPECKINLSFAIFHGNFGIAKILYICACLCIVDLRNNFDFNIWKHSQINFFILVHLLNLLQWLL